ncbi:MAG: TRAP transporter substrate-binding protein DctP [Pseudolabrys sp.]|jgi:TRAP-type C4-dicarboxylate transport system substrate-binding protein
MAASIFRLIAVVFALLPAVASAEPIKLKLAYFSSDRSHLYLSGAKPFVDAVNAEGQGRVEIEVYLNGKLGADLTKQSQLVLDGRADIAYVVHPYERSSFPDSSVIELPGLYRDGRQGTLAFAHLVAAGIMRGYDDFFVIGAFASEPESIHLRPRAASLADLKGKRIRTNNETETAILKQLGATPAFLPINEAADAISSGKIDGALVPPVPMVEFGIGRVATNHYFLRTTCVPQALLMSRKKFDSLPGDVQALIRKYSGDWFTRNYIRINEASTLVVMNQLESDPHRKVVFPTPADLLTADAIFKSIVDGYAAGSSHNSDLVAAARAEVAKLRQGN